MIAQYQLDAVKLNSTFKWKVLNILKSVDVRYLPNESHAKYYLLCYAMGYKPKISLSSGDIAQEPTNGTTTIGYFVFFFLKIKTFFAALERNYIRFFYKFYLHILLLMALLFSVFLYPLYTISFLYISSM